jgi:phosphate-selective porin OprO/OprP
MRLGLLALVLGVGGRAPAQEAPVPSPPALPEAPRTAREAELEERLRQMEALLRRMPDPEQVRRLEERLHTLPDPEHVRKLESTVERLSTRVDQLSTRLRRAEAAARRPTGLNGTRVGPGASAGAGMSGSPAEGPLDDRIGPGGAGETTPGGGAAPVGPSAELPSARFDMPEPIPDIPATTRFGPGFQIRSPDDEFDIQFHDLTQLDGRFYGIPSQNPVTDTFTIPRQWFIFSGHLSRPYEYYLSITESFDGFSILDVFLNVNYDRRLQFRIGRGKSPFTYEFWGVPTQGLPNGEWSLFFNNFGMNRDLGAMLWGESVAGRIDYAAGIFNSTPNAQFDLSNPKSLIAFLNFAPFRPARDSALENVNIGGSLVAGDQDHVPVPQELRTIVPIAGNAAIGVPFLAFNNNVGSTACATCGRCTRRIITAGSRSTASGRAGSRIMPWRTRRTAGCTCRSRASTCRPPTC